MTQVYANNEFVFGENGGKGTHLTLFLKNLSLTSQLLTPSSDHSGSNIYGTLSHSGPPSPKKQTRSVSAPVLVEERRPKHHKYTDLDDDWDADIDDKGAKAPATPAPPLKRDQSVTSTATGLSRYAKFAAVLSSDHVNLTELRKLAWNGVPGPLRAVVWQLLLGYLPANKSRTLLTVRRKRQEYADGISALAVDFDDNTAPPPGLSRDKQLYHQINIDIKRTRQGVPLYAHAATQRSLRRVLYLWAVRHPASGYVQGINDLVTPFFELFLASCLDSTADGWRRIPDVDLVGSGASIRDFDPALLPESVALALEADTYWCLSRVLETITDNYIHEQPGILRQVDELRNLVARIDADLLRHLDTEGVQFLQFAFRWMNCLLMREMSVDLVVRMWDTYLSEVPLGFNAFHVYVCAAFLVRFSSDVKDRDFQEILLFLQSPPTSSWSERDVELMLSEAYIWQSLYKNAAAHLR